MCGASSAGLTAIWIQRALSEPPEELGFAANRVVRAIGDLALVGTLVETQAEQNGKRFGLNVSSA
jgi:hypothetical protein